MWLKKLSQTEGYILLEAFISLSILVLLLAGTLPYFVDVFEVRNQSKSDVELKRLLYESAMVWEGKYSSEDVKSGNVKATSQIDTNQIIIRGEDGNETGLEILSVKWAE